MTLGKDLLSEDTKPESVTVKARDIKPYHYGVWSSLRDPDTGRESKPFSNTVCLVRWSKDGNYLYLGLETHNSIKIAPDGLIEVIPECGPNSWARERYANWELPPPPKTRYDHRYKWSASGPECDLCGFLHEPNLEPLED